MPKNIISLSVDDKTHEQIKEVAKREQRSMASLIRYWIQQALKRVKGGDPSNG